MRLVLIYVLAALGLWLVLRWVTHMDRYELLTAQGATTSGSISSTDCGNHGSFNYEFLVQGQSFHGSGKQSEGGVSCAALAAGQRVPVTYLAASPTVSVAGNPKVALAEARLFATAGAISFPALVLWLRSRARK